MTTEIAMYTYCTSVLLSGLHVLRVPRRYTPAAAPVLIMSLIGRSRTHSDRCLQMRGGITDSETSAEVLPAAAAAADQ